MNLQGVKAGYGEMVVCYTSNSRSSANNELMNDTLISHINMLMFRQAEDCIPLFEVV